MRRTLRYDGVVAQVADADGIRAIADYVARERPSEVGQRPFEIIAQGTTPPDADAAAAIVHPYADAGATWWIDADWDVATVDSQRARIAAGPPRA
jgi:hypothetical protein